MFFRRNQRRNILDVLKRIYYEKYKKSCNTTFFRTRKQTFSVKQSCLIVRYSVDSAISLGEQGHRSLYVGSVTNDRFSGIPNVIDQAAYTATAVVFRHSLFRV